MKSIESTAPKHGYEAEDIMSRATSGESATRCSVLEMKLAYESKTFSLV